MTAQSPADKLDLERLSAKSLRRLLALYAAGVIEIPDETRAAIYKRIEDLEGGRQ